MNLFEIIIGCVVLTLLSLLIFLYIYNTYKENTWVIEYYNEKNECIHKGKIRFKVEIIGELGSNFLKLTQKRSVKFIVNGENVKHVSLYNKNMLHYNNATLRFDVLSLYNFDYYAVIARQVYYIQLELTRKKG